MSIKAKKILLTGGGTGGSVSPLLAIAEGLKAIPTLPLNPLPRGEKYEFFWLGTETGPEREMVEKARINFKPIKGGKFRRYFSLKNFFDLFSILIGFFQSFFFILKWRPNLIITAGSFISVPAVWAGWLLKAPILIHQQDIRAGLANKLMAPFARLITVTFPESLADYGRKAVWTGNPVRPSLTHNISNSKNDPLIVFVVGGGTGAEVINKLVWESLAELTKFCQIIHVVGKGKMPNYQLPITNYQFFEFLEHEKVMEIMEAADLIVSRAGLGFLTEISYLAKPAILIPMLDSHQEENAEIFAEKGGAIVLNQKELTKENFINNIKKLLTDRQLRIRLASNAGKVMKRGANEAIARIAQRIMHNV